MFRAQIGGYGARRRLTEALIGLKTRLLARPEPRQGAILSRAAFARARGAKGFPERLPGMALRVLAAKATWHPPGG